MLHPAVMGVVDDSKMGRLTEGKRGGDVAEHLGGDRRQPGQSGAKEAYVRCTWILPEIALTLVMHGRFPYSAISDYRISSALPRLSSSLHLSSGKRLKCLLYHLRMLIVGHVRPLHDVDHRIGELTGATQLLSVASWRLHDKHKSH